MHLLPPRGVARYLAKPQEQNGPAGVEAVVNLTDLPGLLKDLRRI
jgi:hypothetical protein